MSETPPGNGLRVTGPGGLSVAATGREVIIVLLLMVLAALVYRGFEANATQHHHLTRAFDRLGCLFSFDLPERLDALQSGDPCAYAMSARRRGMDW